MSEKLDGRGASDLCDQLGPLPEDELRKQAFLILSRLQSGTENVVRLDAAIAAVAAERERWTRLRAALVDTLDFVERHSNRWDGVNGKHPMEVVTAARMALGPNVGAKLETTAPAQN